MTVSWHEVAAIAVGLGGGYWFVSRIIEGRGDEARAYKRRISEYHPDKVAQMGEEIRALAERRSKEINAAYDEAMRRI